VLETFLPQVTDEQTLEALAQAMHSVFSRWRLAEPEQRRLLATEQRLRLDAHQLANNPMALERIGQLLAIDRALTARGLTSWWIRTPHPNLLGESPLDTMLRQGVPGMRKVREMLS
jgi:hypothetical protein